MAMTPEGKVKKQVKEYLQSIGAWYYMPVSNGMGRVGCPDILVCYQGLFMAFETKAPGKIKNVTANQWVEDIIPVRKDFPLDDYLHEDTPEAIAAKEALCKQIVDGGIITATYTPQQEAA